MSTLTGISQRIDNCAGLIVQRAHLSWLQIPAEHKKWIDTEDLIQDGLIAAMEASNTWDEAGAARFSSYLFTGLKFRFSKYYHTPLSQQKRYLASVVELDAPMSETDDRHFELPSVPPPPMHQRELLEQFTRLCKRLSPPAAIMLIRGLLCGGLAYKGKRPEMEDVLLREVRTLSKRINLSALQLSELYEDEEMRTKALKSVSGIVTLGLGEELDARVLECVACRGQLFLSDIRKGRYDVETLTCRTCLEKMKKAPASESCFGKATEYDPSSSACSQHCSDSKICAKTIREDKTMSTKANPLDEVDFSKVDAKAKKAPAKKVAPVKATAKASGKAVKKAAPAKAVAKAAAAKPKKVVVESDAPNDVYRWPFKKGSMMQLVFKLAYEGIEQAELESKVTKIGRSPKIAMDVLRGGLAGCGAINGTADPTHTWKLSEENGFLKLTKVKYVGPKDEVAKAPAKASKKAKAEPEQEAAASA